jgi:hypothetical protein
MRTTGRTTHLADIPVAAGFAMLDSGMEGAE